MKSLFAVVAALALQAPALAAPFPKADPAAGAKLFDDAKCTACHAQRFGGDGSAAFTRTDRRVKSADTLLKQVRACVTQLNVQWFADEEEHVAAYLNQKYYKFK
ncbi:MAG: cytochrome c [Burkholderiales bacterium]